ncbi:MAG TPA: hypothetical protein VFC46_11440 [Humisphaera sp.]|nr:hypothetical protein [Humisphaera sp.]
MIRDAGEGWLIDWYGPKAEALPKLLKLLANADLLARKRFGASAPRLTPQDLIAEFKRNPHKIRALLQVLDSLSPDMLVMVWRVLQGMGVASIRMEYDAEQRFSLNVRLSSEDGGAEEYSSTEIDDAVVLRHLGIVKMNGQPLFDGFYALNLDPALNQSRS